MEGKAKEKILLQTFLITFYTINDKTTEEG
jgi:hypothetical protein